ncbi:hypothetical protein TNCV_2813271 [Trichonephila clavipes]|nr:hypothetical protein TNCV_2813271 [Trichonephila clavipes]
MVVSFTSIKKQLRFIILSHGEETKTTLELEPLASNITHVKTLGYDMLNCICSASRRNFGKLRTSNTKLIRKQDQDHFLSSEIYKGMEKVTVRMPLEPFPIRKRLSNLGSAL